MIENNMINDAVEKFSDNKEANRYFIHDLVSTWKQRSEFLFESYDQYLEFMHRFHYIFESWKNDLNKLIKPTHRLTMARFLMLVYRLDNLLERNVFQNITDPSEVLRQYYLHQLN